MKKIIKLFYFCILASPICYGMEKQESKQLSAVSSLAISKETIPQASSESWSENLKNKLKKDNLTPEKITTIYQDACEEYFEASPIKNLLTEGQKRLFRDGFAHFANKKQKLLAAQKTSQSDE